MNPSKASDAPAGSRQAPSTDDLHAADLRRVEALEKRFPDEDLSVLRVSLFLDRAKVSVDRRLSERLKPYRLTPVALQALISIFIADAGPLDFSALSRDLRVTKANISWVLNTLEKHGLAERETDQLDGRKIRAHLTPRGRKLARELIPLARDCFEESFSQLGDEQREQLKELAGRVV